MDLASGFWDKDRRGFGFLAGLGLGSIQKMAGIVGYWYVTGAVRGNGASSSPGSYAPILRFVVLQRISLLSCGEGDCWAWRKQGKKHSPEPRTVVVPRGFHWILERSLYFALDAAKECNSLEYELRSRNILSLHSTAYLFGTNSKRCSWSSR